MLMLRARAGSVGRICAWGRRTRRLAFVFVCALAISAPGVVRAEAPVNSPCRVTEAGRALDFWLGEWRVELEDGGGFAGEDVVRVTLGGCAIEEIWTSSRGGAGRSLFAYNALTDRWEQLWVTADTSMPGGVKHKTMVSFAHGVAVFEGQVETAQGRYLDRTTLTQRPDGSVLQRIEMSLDGGQVWRVTFSGVYRRGS